ncbi:hypothetical protein [Proteiniborus sp. MB09-C3]|uniref:hypothetical protein n=1 Tax=Proteiniborus sp. MB09-C3 TaxID=3050072 RepID=UPI0025578E08|nr:hypothetical protein [Proteiniborus sp. MB09-C3]WIV12514.1 hypothetical protein QO263_01940 [Proteiniborus sp. MB09-C3]
MIDLIKSIVLKMFLLLLVVALPIATYIFIEDDVQLTWNINNIKEMNKYTIIAEFFPEKERLEIIENVQYINKANKSMDKLFFHFNSTLKANEKLCQDFEEELATKEGGMSYKIGEIEAIKIRNKKVDFKIIGKDKNLLMISLDKELEKDDKVIIEIKYSIIVSHMISTTNDGTVKYMLSSWYPIAAQYNNGWELEPTYGSNELGEGTNYYFVEIIVPEEFKVETSGRLVEKIKKKQNYFFKFQDQGTLDFNVNIISTKK